MRTREELFYEVSMREIAEARLDPSAWGKALSVTLGDVLKAQALYIELRTGQLERAYQHSATELVRESWAAIIRSKPFLCPYCESRTMARTHQVDYLVWFFSKGPRYRYYCGSCKVELHASGISVEGKPFDRPAAEKSNNGVALTGFILGLSSVFLYFIGIIPILAALFSGFGLASFNPEAQKNRWMAGVGLALGLVYTVMMLDHYGHLK